MRVVVGRLVAAIAVVSGAVYMMQMADIPAPVSRAELASPVDNYPSLQAAGGNRDNTANRSVVPFGHSSLELPILMYHYIRTPPSRQTDLIGYNLSVSPTVFTAEMDWLSEHGYHPVTFNDVRLYWQHVQRLPSKPVIITLDDGYADLYTTAFPILARHEFTAVAYIVSGFVGLKGYVTADQVKQMDQYGLEIAAHTVNHADLERAPEPWLSYQLVQSKRWLERLLGHPVLDMAYPSGKFNQQTLVAVQRAGYYSATTEVYGTLHSQSDRYLWTRVRVQDNEPIKVFMTDLGPTMPTVTVTSFTKSPVRVAMLTQT